MATSPRDPNPPERTIVEKHDVVRTQTRIAPDPGAANKTAWITGLSVLALVLFVGFFWMMAKPSDVKTEHTNVTVNRTDFKDPAPDTTTVVTTEPQDVQLFVTDTEHTITRLSRPDDAANQAEIEAIRRRTEDLRSADKAQAQAIQVELRDRIAKLESQNEALASSNDGDTTSVTTTTTTSEPVATASAPDPKMVDDLTKRLDAATTELTEVSQTATPQVAEGLPALNEELTNLKKQMDDALRAPIQEQSSLFTDFKTDLVAFETKVKSLSTR